MKRLFLAATALVAVSAPVCAQTAVGVGVAKSQSTAISGAKATAISGQGGAGGTGVGNVTVNNPSNVAVPGSVTTTRVENTGTSTVRNVPSVFAPGLAAAGIESCQGSVSAGGSFVGTGLTFGTSTPDPSCNARLDARQLWALGLRRAAVARLCLSADIYRSMPEVCSQYLPQVQATGYALTERPQAVPTYYGTPARNYYLSEGETYKSGPIMLTDGNTNKERLCNDYDAPAQRCRVWANIVSSSKPSKSKKVRRDPTPAVAQLTKDETK